MPHQQGAARCQQAEGQQHGQCQPDELPSFPPSRDGQAGQAARWASTSSRLPGCSTSSAHRGSKSWIVLQVRVMLVHLLEIGNDFFFGPVIGHSGPAGVFAEEGGDAVIGQLPIDG